MKVILAIQPVLQHLQKTLVFVEQIEYTRGITAQRECSNMMCELDADIGCNTKFRQMGAHKSADVDDHG